MASTYTARLKMEVMEAGANSGTWGNNTNDNLKVIDASVGGYLSKSVSGSAVTLYDGDAYANGSHKVYLANKSTDATEYFTITINSEQVGKLYAGDWMFFPWEAAADTSDIKYQPSVTTGMVLEHMIIFE